MNKVSDKTLAHTIAAIDTMDLSLIKFKATRQEDGYGWSGKRADQIEAAYKRYLILHAKYPGMTLAPERDVDRFWHLHILDTRKYAADCDEAFGHFVHHFPYLGLRGEDDALALQAAFDAMQALYAREFGEMPPAANASAAWCGVDPARPQAAWCGVDPARPATSARTAA
jgi:hypothetical protein